MSRLVVIVPSRGRPANAWRFAQHWALGTDHADLRIAVDDDDPELPGYREHFSEPTLVVGPRKRMVPTLNDVAMSLVDEYDALGFAGDDHCLRTRHGDKHIMATLEEPGVGIVYGNDLLQGEMLPTFVFLRASIVKALGYMAPPGCLHLFVDNAWKAWGQGARCLRYLPDLVLEHLHPLVGKAPGDAGYDEVNELYGRDRKAWELYERVRLNQDVEKIKVAMLAPAQA